MLFPVGHGDRGNIERLRFNARVIVAGDKADRLKTLARHTGRRQRLFIAIPSRSEVVIRPGQYAGLAAKIGYWGPENCDDEKAAEQTEFHENSFDLNLQLTGITVANPSTRSKTRHLLYHRATDVNLLIQLTGAQRQGQVAYSFGEIRYRDR